MSPQSRTELQCAGAKLSLVCKGIHKRVSHRPSSSIKGHMAIRNAALSYVGCVRSKVMTLGSLRADRKCLISLCPLEAELSSWKAFALPGGLVTGLESAVTEETQCPLYLSQRCIHASRITRPGSLQPAPTPSDSIKSSRRNSPATSSKKPSQIPGS